MVGDILQHMTVGQVRQIAGGLDEITYKQFVIPNKVFSGRSVSHRISFDSDAWSKESIPERKLLDKSFEIFTKEGGTNANEQISVVNPALFRALKYFVYVGADAENPKSKGLEKALKLEAYDRFIVSPYANQETVFEDFLVDTLAPGKIDRYKNKQLQGQTTSPIPPLGNTNANLLGQITGSSSLQNIMSNQQ